MIFVDLPETGVSVTQGCSLGAVESVKATSDDLSLITSKIFEVFPKLKEAPGLAILLGEAITGKGILARLNLEIGISIYEVEALLFFILFTLLGAIGPLGVWGPFVDTGLEKAVIPPGKSIRRALGLKESATENCGQCREPWKSTLW